MTEEKCKCGHRKKDHDLCGTNCNKLHCSCNNYIPSHAVHRKGDMEQESKVRSGTVGSAEQRTGLNSSKKALHETSPELVEELAELEHQQWEQWSRNVFHDFHNIRRCLDESLDYESARNICIERGKRWNKNWKPYSELTEDVKEQDRIWARKVLKIIEKHKRSK